MEALVLWEISKKQQYIFSSNRLKENRGASIIIEDISEKMPYDFEEDYKEDLVYNGGGSSLYKFCSIDRARGFIKNISVKVLRDYPGVELFMVIEEYDKKKDKVTESIDNAYKKLAIKKNRRVNSGGQLSFGIERLCESTGFPASFKERDDETIRYVSREIKTKIDNSNGNSKKFDYLLPVQDSIRDFRDLTKGEKNYIAVVHIDGNQMGKKLQMLKDGFKYEGNNIEETNDEYLKALKQFSDDIKNAYEGSFKYMAGKIQENEEGELNKVTKIGEGKFPLIPIIIAGDDVTYVTNGKIGIESARLFIEHLNSYKININGQAIELNACAGIAITRVGHQFYRAYELAEDLCNNAKKKVLKDYGDRGKDYSLLDWHIEQGDVMGTIAEIRKKHYRATDGRTLNMRPLYINNNDKWTNYENFKRANYYITEHKVDNKEIARNKVKRLRDILVKGENETKMFLLSNKLYYYFPCLDGTTGDYCYHKNQCMYYDAIESLDLFNQLK